MVSFETASRDGEPFEAVIRQRNYLPNPVTRFCTSELKIRVMHKWLRASWARLGWDAQDMEWDQMIGIRADEMRRVSKIRARGHSTETTKETMRMPLADAGVTLADIDDFAAGLQMLYEQPERRKLIADKGMAWSRAHTWDGAADVVMQTVERVMSRQQTQVVVPSTVAMTPTAIAQPSPDGIVKQVELVEAT